MICKKNIFEKYKNFVPVEVQSLSHVFLESESTTYISCNVAGCPNSHLPKGRSVDAHPYALFLELQDTMSDFLNFYPHHFIVILRISFICFT